jgi:GntR family transcriptional regulator
MYVQLEDILTRKISNGEWKPNERIPSENELKELYGLSRMTARAVLNNMTASGLLFRVPGKGTFVAPEKASVVSPAYRGVREQLESLGYTTTTTLLDVRTEHPVAAVAELFGLGPDETAIVIDRLRAVDGEPVSFHRSFVPAALAPDLASHDLTGEQLCVILRDNYSLEMGRVEEYLEAVAPSRRQSDLLKLRRGDPAIMLSDTIFNRKGLVYEHSTIVFRGDRVKLHFAFDL